MSFCYLGKGYTCAILKSPIISDIFLKGGATIINTVYVYVQPWVPDFNLSSPLLSIMLGSTSKKFIYILGPLFGSFFGVVLRISENNFFKFQLCHKDCGPL